MISKSVLITGCASGIGYQTALYFAEKGYATFASVHSLQSENAKKLSELAKKEYPSMFVIELDVASDVSVHRAFDVIQSNTSTLDVLVNNAGFGYLGPLEDFSMEELKEQFETNYFGTVRVIKAVLPLMRKKQKGSIISITSINGLVSFPLYGAYSSSKFALETYLEVLRFEVRPFGIQVSIVEPGVFKTDFWSNRKHPRQSEIDRSAYKKLLEFFRVTEAKKNVEQSKILGRLIHPVRVAHIIYHLAETDRPPLRTLVGLDARIFYIMRRILPDTIWHWLLSKVYRW